MSETYAPKLAADKNNNVIQEVPFPFTAKVTTAAAAPAASSVITFGSNTTAIEITALNASLAIKWGSGSVIGTAGATANFDHIVPVNTTRRFVIPRNTIGATGSVVGGNALNGLYSTMAVIAVSSTVTAYTEY